MTATTPREVAHRSRALVDVTLGCGCVLTYEFEFEAKPRARTFSKHLTVAVPGGWWVSTLWHPGEVTEECKQIGSRCAMDVETQGIARDAALRKALDYMRTVAPNIKEAACKG
jgi:hypothetical protein